ncbi:MAG: cohesin domain-containing protein [Candidatus Magasanikbacteria bacterium]|nr:cohesin domain-containing protein [Candidatus Magasanikbacteria bacterium]
MKKIIFLLLVASIYLFIAADVFAADFLFFGVPQSVNAGDEFKIDAVIDAKKLPINALSGKIIFSENLLDVNQILTGNSGINFWIESPKISQPGTIDFSGIVTNGFDGELVLFSAIFKAKSHGEANIEYTDIQALLNDGNGTKDIPSSKNISVKITVPAEGEPAKLFTAVDSEQPDDFIPQIVKTANLFNGDYTIIFQAQDKQSGIDHYEIMERKTYRLFNNEFEFGIWKNAESPFRLSDQKLQSNIFVKAIDEQGNERVAYLPASNPILWYENRLIWSIIILIAAIIFACVLLYARKKDKNHQ